MTKSLIVREGRIELESEMAGKPLISVYPAKGPGTYANVAQEIIEAGLALPRGAETASLVGAAFNDLSSKYSREIKQTMDNGWLWVFTQNLYVPQKGVYLYDGTKKLNESELVTRLEARDKSVRFVPFGYKTGVQKPSELAKNAFVTALFGKEGAEKLAKIAESCRNIPRVWSFSNVDEEIARVSGLCGCVGSRLLVFGDSFVDYDDGYAFGVSPSADEGSASAPKNK